MTGSGGGAEHSSMGNADGSAHTKTTVGASLLAKASCQSASLKTDTPLSRAGSLPQGAMQVLTCL
ncbi:hypothetical protein EGJ55_06125 [Pseudomonas moraviensis]|nr:hypothetical protein EGJ55_06125 [Pseudomonas moraviensis]